MRKALASLAILSSFTLAAANSCGGTPPKCPIGYVAEKDTHGNWGCYPAR